MASNFTAAANSNSTGAPGSKLVAQRPKCQAGSSAYPSETSTNIGKDGAP